MIRLPLFLLPLCLAHRSPRPNQPSTIGQLAQFPNETWVENIAVRSNGNLLVTLFTSPDLYQLDPFQPHCVPQLVARFPSALGLLGIAEISPDVFAVVKGTFAPSGALKPGSFSIWKADFTGNRYAPAISPIADVPRVTIVNGIAQPMNGSRFLLMADSLAGVIWRLDILSSTGSIDVVLNHTSTQPIGTIDQGGFRVDGLHVRDGFLYYTNTNKGFFRVPVDTFGTVMGQVQTLTSFPGADDFAFDDFGTAYASRGGEQSIVSIVPGGEVTTLEFKDKGGYGGESPEILLEGNTGVAFGRTKRDHGTLYVTTNGGIEGVVKGTPVVGGRVLAVELGKSD